MASQISETARGFKQIGKSVKSPGIAPSLPVHAGSWTNTRDLALNIERLFNRLIKSENPADRRTFAKELSRIIDNWFTNPINIAVSSNLVTLSAGGVTPDLPISYNKNSIAKSRLESRFLQIFDRNVDRFSKLTRQDFNNQYHSAVSQYFKSFRTDVYLWKGTLTTAYIL